MGLRRKPYTFRREGFTKVIEYDIAQKGKDVNTLLGHKRSNVLGTSTTQHDDTKVDADGDAEMNSESESGEDIAHSDDSDSDSDAPKKTKKSSKAGENLKDAPVIDVRGRVKGARGRSERLIVPDEARAHLRRLFSNEHTLCSLIFGPHGALTPVDSLGISSASADNFFVEVLAIPPSRFRPPAQRGGQLMEHPQNSQLGKILASTYAVRDLSKQLKESSEKKAERVPSEQERNSLIQKLLNQLVQLQVEYNVFVDSSKNPSSVARSGTLAPGVKNILEKKAGLFRQNMMGKRVNYAARSVISPDVNIESNEIGVPPVFARKLTFPEPVTQHNVHVMRQLVINGPKNYPGANMVQFEDGSIQSLVSFLHQS